jgi:hypothetical protein
MTVTVASFRQSFPEFTDPEIYDGGYITNVLLPLALAFQNARRWDVLTIDYGTGLFVAHYLVLEARAAATTAAGGIPGTVEGIRTAKSVDKVAISYDANTVALEGAAFWNMTTYGIRFYQLTRAYGTGGVQVGAGPAGYFSFGGGWL